MEAGSSGPKPDPPTLHSVIFCLPSDHPIPHRMIRPLCPGCLCYVPDHPALHRMIRPLCPGCLCYIPDHPALHRMIRPWHFTYIRNRPFGTLGITLISSARPFSLQILRGDFSTQPRFLRALLFLASSASEDPALFRNFVSNRAGNSKVFSLASISQCRMS
jgi:hypothetical protein